MEDFSKPSGKSIPLFLKRKWEKQQREGNNRAVETLPRRRRSRTISEKDKIIADLRKELGVSEETTKDPADTNNDNNLESNALEQRPTSPVVWEPQLRRVPDQELTQDERSELSNRVFTASELEERIWKTTVAMFDIQRQLHRGEEIYYEGTYNHGSIYKGWDAFVDMKDIGPTSSSGLGGNQMNSSRRVPADSRWFSSSCGSVSRTKPPAPFPPPLITPPAKVPSTSEQNHQAKTPMKASSQPKSDPIDKGRTSEMTESTPDSGQLPSTRNRQRAAASATPMSSTATRSTEKAIASRPNSTTRASSRPTTPISIEKNDDATSTRKKRKAASTSAITSEEPPPKRINQESSSDESKLTKSASTAVANTRTSKGDHQAPAPRGRPKGSGKKSNKDETPTSAKREKEGETPAPRKRGRPRRKT